MLTVRMLEVTFQVKMAFGGFLRNGQYDVRTILGRGVWWEWRVGKNEELKPEACRPQKTTTVTSGFRRLAPSNMVPLKIENN